MKKECNKSDLGIHELNFETMQFNRYINATQATFDVSCIHCQASGTITVDALEVEWPDDGE